MDQNRKDVADNIRTSADDAQVVFSKNSGISDNGASLVHGDNCTLPADSEPVVCKMEATDPISGEKYNAGYFAYRTPAGLISKSSLFDGLKCLPKKAGQTFEKYDKKVTYRGQEVDAYLVPFRLLTKRCTAKFPFELVKVTLPGKVAKDNPNGDDVEILVPYIAEQVKLHAENKPSYVPVFLNSKEPVTDSKGTKCAVCVLDKDYCLICPDDPEDH